MRNWICVFCGRKSLCTVLMALDGTCPDCRLEHSQPRKSLLEPTATILGHEDFSITGDIRAAYEYLKGMFEGIKE